MKFQDVVKVLTIFVSVPCLECLSTPNNQIYMQKNKEKY